MLDIQKVCVIGLGYIGLTQYIRARYTNQPQWTDVNAEVTKARQEGAKP